MLVEILLLMAAKSRNLIDAARARDHLVTVVFHICPDLILSDELDVAMGDSDRTFDQGDIVDEVLGRLFESFEGYHDLSLLYGSLLIIVLIPNLSILSESIHLPVKIGSWQGLAIISRIIRLAISWSDIEAWLAIEVIV